MAGTIWGRKRDREEVGQDLRWGEWAVYITSLVGGLSLAIAIATIRAMYAGTLSAVLFLIAGVLLFLLMMYASYLHSKGAVERVERAYRTRQRRQNAVMRAERRLEKARAAYGNACNELIGTCKAITDRIDAVRLAYMRSHPDETMPPTEAPWLTDLRTIAAGRIPPELAG
jgi:hypothetical protein